ncbi:MAG: hypothetical protein PHU14_00320 [Methylovulum sp.]|nr:hypothetical protein [Methylovulum sp.]
MNHIRTLAHIRTPRMAKSFRACVNLTGKQQILTDSGRIRAEEYRRLNRVQQAVDQRIVLERGL